MRAAPAELARSALDAAPDAIVIIDGAGIIRFANRQLSALFGYGHDEVIGRPIESLMPDRFRSRHVGHRTSFLNAVRVRPMGAGLELFALRSDGTEFPVEISLSPIQDGEQMLVAAAIRDSTDRKLARAELIAARQAAEHAKDVADHARELADEARETADRANRGKSRFLATASHDLRQPLQSLALLTGSLRRMVSDPQVLRAVGTEALLEAVAQQELAIGSMSRLLNALLDISKLESGAVQPQPSDFSLDSLFAELRNEFASLAGKKGLQLRIGATTAHAYSDPSLVEQILRNLISNAIKYTHEGWVRLQCVPAPGRLVRVEVVDSGIGIPADQLPYIYDEFFQVGVAANSTRDGYGLGLSIVQRLVKLLQLGFDVRSEVGQGSTFTLVLPASSKSVEQPDPSTPIAPPAASTPRDRALILLVEDDLGVRDATRLLLRVEGYRVNAVATIAEALASAAREPSVELVLTDYHLAHQETGIQVVAALREALGRPVKAVLMTGDTSTAFRELPLDARMRVASKPIRADELLSLIRTLLSD